ncbi:hypothetical protein K438DRAFT_2023824 [Mycena galopus ATCC 62051]|nr:hypothetical protein K438DRAFT_2023824 [Mycena galopus ATCC 62051]
MSPALCVLALHVHGQNREAPRPCNHSPLLPPAKRTANLMDFPRTLPLASGRRELVSPLNSALGIIYIWVRVGSLSCNPSVMSPCAAAPATPSTGVCTHGPAILSRRRVFDILFCTIGRTSPSASTINRLDSADQPPL